MQFFDPDKFAVYAEPLMTRMRSPSDPLLEQGLVRDVVLDPQDIPIRCVSFTTREVGGFLGFDPRMFHKYLDTWGWWTPTFKSSNVYPHKSDPVRVYLYPEAQVIVREYRNAQEFGGQIGSRKNPALAARVNNALGAIRDEAKEKPDD